MKLYGIGNALLYYREQKKLSQLQVGEGICSAMTISRIETGEREVDSLISETLLSRIGKTANRFEFVLNAEDYYLYELRENMKKSVEENDAESLKKSLIDYKNNMPENQVLYQQYALYYDAMALKMDKGEIREILRLLHKAIDLTRSDYKDNKPKMILYSTMETMIIYQLFLYEDYTEEMLQSLVRFVEEFYDEEEKAKLLIPFYYEFMQRYEREKKYYKVLKIAEKGIKILLFGRSYLYLADFYFAKMKAEEYLYKPKDDWNAKRGELILLCNEIYYMYMIEENIEMMSSVERFCREKLECQITM